MRAHPTPTLLLALLLASACELTGCDNDIAIGGRCRYSSDCEPGLACAAGRCGAECREHRDCPLGAECLRANGNARCALEDDQGCPCDEGLVCGDDGRCHSRCDDACSDGVCAPDGTCRRADAPDGGTADGGASDGGAAPTGVVPHVACEQQAQCEAEQVCVDDRGWSRACRGPCDSHDDCVLEGSRCHRFDDSGGARLACTLPCDPLSGAGCAEGDACDWLDGLGPDEDYAPHFECRAIVATGIRGDSCGATTYQPDRCASGFHCLYGTANDSSSEYGCVRWCRLDLEGEPNGCAPEETCETFSAARMIGKQSFGYCVPRPRT